MTVQLPTRAPLSRHTPHLYTKTHAEQPSRIRRRGSDGSPIVLTAGALADLLFCTTIQPSDDPSAQAIRNAVSTRLQSPGDAVKESAEEVAERYGDDPDGALRRMRWALALVVKTYLVPEAGPVADEPSTPKPAIG